MKILVSPHTSVANIVKDIIDPKNIIKGVWNFLCKSCYYLHFVYSAPITIYLFYANGQRFVEKEGEEGNAR